MGNENTTNVFRLLRIAKDIKVKDLAEKLRVTSAYVNAIENGTRIPSTRLIKDYSDIFEIDESIILSFHKESGRTRFENMLFKILEIICK